MLSTPFVLDEKLIDTFIDQAFWEDVRDGDITGLACIPTDKRNKAILKIKENGVLAGVAFAERVFKKVDPHSTLKIYKCDGDAMQFGDIAFEVECNTQALLKSERLILNTMQRMSGIATMSRKFAEATKEYKIKILDTRKTTPLFRYFEKWAVAIGGCNNYRFGLYDWFMIKDNHHDAVGGIAKAIESVAAYKKNNPHTSDFGVTLEVRSLDEVQQALDFGKGTVTRLMLDNFSFANMRKAVVQINHAFEIEGSGGVNLKNVRRYALTGVEYVSSGALTHHVSSLDLSLKILK